MYRSRRASIAAYFTVAAHRLVSTNGLALIVRYKQKYIRQYFHTTMSRMAGGATLTYFKVPRSQNINCFDCNLATCAYMGLQK